jgi:hypothetical protein
MKIKRHSAITDVFLMLTTVLNCLQYIGVGVLVYQLNELESFWGVTTLGLAILAYFWVMFFLTSALRTFIRSHEEHDYIGWLVTFFSISLLGGGWIASLISLSSSWIILSCFALLIMTSLLFQLIMNK